MKKRFHKTRKNLVKYFSGFGVVGIIFIVVTTIVIGGVSYFAYTNKDKIWEYMKQYDNVETTTPTSTPEITPTATATAITIPTPTPKPKVVATPTPVPTPVPTAVFKPVCTTPQVMPEASGTAPLSTSLYVGQSSSAPTPDQVRWDFTGDGNWDLETSFGSSPDYTYQIPGTFTLKVQIRGNNGQWSDTCQTSVTVN